MWKLYISIIIITSSLLTFGYNKSNVNNDFKNQSNKKIVEDSVKIDKDTSNIIKNVIDTTHHFSIKNFKIYLKQINAPHAHVIYAIARQESGFCSFLFKTHNNLFGMTRPNVRTNKSIQNGQKWAKFHHWTHSVDDMILWIEWTTIGKANNYSEQQFLKHIDNNYAHSGYTNVIKKHFKEFNY